MELQKPFETDMALFDDEKNLFERYSKNIFYLCWNEFHRRRNCMKNIVFDFYCNICNLKSYILIFH